MISLVNNARALAGKKSLGWINPSIYKYYNIFSNDITEGNNQCTMGGDCCKFGFNATIGWDAGNWLIFSFIKITKLFCTFCNSYRFWIC
jgi:hypothetical protein